MRWKPSHKPETLRAYAVAQELYGEHADELSRILSDSADDLDLVENLIDELRSKIADLESRVESLQEEKDVLQSEVRYLERSLAAEGAQ